MKRVPEQETVAAYYARVARGGRAVIVGSHDTPETWVVRLQPTIGPPRYFLAFAEAERIREMGADQPVPRFSVSAPKGWRSRRQKGATAA